MKVQYSVCNLYDLPFFFLLLAFFMDNDADKRIVLGSDGPCEGVATSLRFPSKTGSFTFDNYGKEAGPADEQPDSPIKTSPVSERIKALEALVAQRNQPDFRSDRGFFHVRDYHSEKSSIEKITPFEKSTPTKTTEEISDKQSSPVSPPGDFDKMNEFEETEEWMKAHLPPVPTFDVVNLVQCNLTSDDALSKVENENDEVIPDDLAVFAGDSDVDSPVDLLKQQQTQPDIEGKPAVDLGFLPPAYKWGQTETSVIELASDSNSAEEKLACSGDGEPPEVSEAESSGESEDTVIEDGVHVHSESSHVPVCNDGTMTLTSTALNPTEVKDIAPPTSERKLMQVPTINVIETDEQQYSDEEMDLELEEVEDYNKVVKEQCTEVPKSPEPDSEDSENEPTGTCPTETDFMEVYSPPSSPAGSDTEHSPERKIVDSLSKSGTQELASKPESLFGQTISKGSEQDPFQAACGNKEIYSNYEKTDFADNNEWSEEAQDVVKTEGTDPQIEETSDTPLKVNDQCIKASEEIEMRRAFVSRASLIQDDFYERQSFDSDYGVSSALDCIDCTEQISAKERFLSSSSQVITGELSSCTAKNEAPEDDHNMEMFISLKEDEHFSRTIPQAISRDCSQDLNSNVESNEELKIHEQDLSETASPDIVCEKMENLFLPELKNGEETQQDTKEAHIVPDNQSTNPTDYKNPDSFVDFMRECLKSQQDEEEVQDETQSGDSSSEKEHLFPSSQFTPTVVMDLEQEKLTISLLKELGSSQEEETVSLPTEVPGQDDVNPTITSVKQSPLTSVSEHTCPQSDIALGCTYSKGVEAIDKWVAEAYHLTEHVLTAILTHFSGNPSFCQ